MVTLMNMDWCHQYLICHYAPVCLHLFVVWPHIFPPRSCFTQRPCLLHKSRRVFLNILMEFSFEHTSPASTEGYFLLLHVRTEGKLCGQMEESWTQILAERYPKIIKFLWPLKVWTKESLFQCLFKKPNLLQFEQIQLCFWFLYQINHLQIY